MAKKKTPPPPRMPTLEDKWAAIAEAAIHSAERVECDLVEFARGLQQIEGEIRDRRQLAEDEAKHLE